MSVRVRPAPPNTMKKKDFIKLIRRMYDDLVPPLINTYKKSDISYLELRSFSNYRPSLESIPDDIIYSIEANNVVVTLRVLTLTIDIPLVRIVIGESYMKFNFKMLFKNEGNPYLQRDQSLYLPRIISGHHKEKLMEMYHRCMWESL